MNLKKIIHYNQAEFIPGMQRWLNICKLTNVIHHINKMKDKYHVILSIYAGKSFDKIQYLFMKKKAQQIGCRKNIPQQQKKATYDKLTAKYSVMKSTKLFLQDQKQD